MTRHDERAEAILWRARLLAACLGLAAVAFRQAPGLVVADTKLDLTLNPWGLLAKSLHLWDPQGAFGQLQNQAYGYLFPMGPFHAVLHSLGVAPWVVQRLWWTTLLCVAFLGIWRLASELQVGTRWLRLVGALLFALSPRISSELTVTSVEVWPMAVAPWVLLPLVVRGERTWWWRISRSAMAFALCGGVNAVASGAALVLPALWFLTRRPSKVVAVAMAGWLAAMVAAMAWWLLPLVLLGRYSPPFLDWIEGAAVTTSTASPFETLRGTSAWLAFLTTSTGPEWPGGWEFATQPMVVLGTALVAALGLAGLALRSTPERLLLGLGAVVGLVLLGVGHQGALGAPFAVSIQQVLDGPLAALRNAHKFDVVVRIPLSLGAVASLSAGVAWLRRLGARQWVGAVSVTSLVVIATTPALVAVLSRNEAYHQVPQYWRQAAHWLDEQPDAGSVLVLPAASFADFTWGSTKDDPLQALMERPFAVRDAVPLGSAGATRWLDGVERDLGSGQGGPGTARALATAGVRFVVVRNDLRLDAQGDRLVAVHAGLEQSGLDRVAGFGPLSGNPGESPRETVDYRTLLQRSSVEVFRVPGTASAWLQPASDTQVASAGPEDASAWAGSTASPLVVTSTDAERAGLSSSALGAGLVTDGLRRREVNFGAPTHNMSEVFTAQERPRQHRPAWDFVNDAKAAPTTTTWTGIADVRASSSASDANATLRLGPANRPGAALDGDASTRWISGTFGSAVGEWIEVRLEEAAKVAGLRLDLSTGSPVGARPTKLRVSTQAGTKEISVPDKADSLFVGLPDGETSWVRVTLDDVGPGVENGFAVSELSLTGIAPQEALRTPKGEGADYLVMRRDAAGRPGCLTVLAHSYCAPSNALEPDGPAVMSRVVELAEGGSFAMRGTVHAVSSTRTDNLFTLGKRLTAKASSRLVDSPTDRPGAAVDRDLGTGWVAGVNDFDPTFTISLPGERSVSGLQFLRDPSLAASGPNRVAVTFSDGTTSRAEVDDEGYVRFASHSTRTVRIAFGATRPLVNIDSTTGGRTFVPVGFSEVRVLGADDLRQTVPVDAESGAPCGFGPTLVVNGRAHPTAVEGTLGDIASGRALAWHTCGPDPVPLLGATNVITVGPSGEYTPESMTFARAGVGESPAPRALTVQRDDPDNATLELPARSSESIVALAQNFNAGWGASVDGKPLRAVRVNGWMQGWVVPAGGEQRLDADYRPDSGYRAGLAAGLAALVLLFGLGRLSRGQRRLPPEPATPPRWLAFVMVPLTGLVMGGAWVLLIGIAAAGFATPLLRRRRPHAVAASLVFLMPAAAGLLVAMSPWPGGRSNFDSVVVQALSLAGVLLTLALTLVRNRPSGRHLPG